MLFACAVVAHADEAKMTAIPDMSRISDFEGRTFQNSSGVKIQGARGFKKDMTADQSFQTASYTSTRSFLGIKNPWFGSKVATGTKPWNMESQPSFKNFDRQVEVKSATGDRPYLDQSKAADSRQPVPVKQGELRATAQGSIDSISDHVRKDMSVEDLRKLLNKGH